MKSVWDIFEPSHLEEAPLLGLLILERWRIVCLLELQLTTILCNEEGGMMYEYGAAKATINNHTIEYDFENKIGNFFTGSLRV